MDENLKSTMDGDLGIDIVTIERLQEWRLFWKNNESVKLEEGEFRDFTLNAFLIELLDFWRDIKCSGVNGDKA